MWTGGTEHMIAQYSKNGYTRKSSAITREGGDFQDLHLNGDVVYGACHCGDSIFEGSQSYYGYWEDYSQVHNIRLVAAFDRESGKVLGEFNPILKGARGFGVWESFVDSRGNLWVGGDINRSLGEKGEQRTVGFARYAPRDVTPPAAPSGLRAQRSGNNDKLSWSGAEQGARYQVIRNGRVIATVTGTDYSVAHQDGARYSVRAVDASDNYSAGSPEARV